MLKDTENYIDAKEFIPGALGERIAFLRKRNKMTQAMVAEQLGISAQAVSKWESGLSCPDIMTLVPLAKVLGVKMSSMFCEEEKTSVTEIEEEPEVRTDEDQTKEEKPELEPQVDNTNFVIVSAGASQKQEISSLTISTGACAAVIETGDEFAMRTEGYEPGEVTSEIVDGVWKVKDVARTFLFSGRNVFSKRKLFLTVPEDYIFDVVKLSIGAGTMTAAGIHAEKCTVNVGAGDVKIKDISSSHTRIKCGMGEVTIKGELYGKCDMNCGMGSIKAFLRKPEHYGYRASVGMGEARIGDSRISGLGGEQTVNAGDSNFYDISCSMGSVVVKFE